MDADVACSIDRPDKVQGISSPALVKKGAEGRILKYSSDYIDFVWNMKWIGTEAILNRIKPEDRVQSDEREVTKDVRY